MQAAARRNIEDYASGPFRPHGEMEIWLEGHVVCIKATGPFNTESIQAMGKALRALYAEIAQPEKLVHLVTIQRSLLASPEVVKTFGDFLAAMDAIQQTPVAVAWVVAPEVEGGRLMLPFFAKTYASAGREFRAFENATDAYAWLQTRLPNAQTPIPGQD